jgi:hypothetical protein
MASGRSASAKQRTTSAFVRHRIPCFAGKPICADGYHDTTTRGIERNPIMKSLRLLCISIAVALAGCAAQPQLSADKVDGLQVCNADAMAQVEQDARKNDRQVIWGACPTWTLRPSST